MIVTKPQSQNLHKYLTEVFSYRETITEVYDHVLSALEMHEGDLPFQDVVNNIIKNDFGGKEKFFNLEKRFKAAAANEITSQIWHTFFKNLKLWGVLIGFALFISSFNYRSIFMNKQIIFGILMVVGFASFILSGLRTFRSGYLFGMEKNSVKDRILMEVTAIPMRFVLIIVMLNTVTAKNILSGLSPNVQYGATITVYTALSVFSLSYYQCFHKEYSLKAINN